MKKILLGIFLILGFLQSLYATNFYNPQDRSFKAGFEAGLKALEHQKLVEGVRPKEIVLVDTYYLTLDIRNMPLAEILFLENISAREGFKSFLTKDYLIYADFKRKADALEIQKQLKQNFKIDTKVNYAEKKQLITYPSLWGEFYTYFLKEAQEKGYVLKTEVIEIPKVITKTKYIKVKEEAPKPTIKGAIINSKAMSYVLKGDKAISANYTENGFYNKQDFTLEGKSPIITASGERFYKVKGQNLYFNTRDIRVSE